MERDKLNNGALMVDVEIKHFHLFCGLGGGAKGFNRGHARVGNMRAKFRCIGGIDNDPAAIRDFSKLAGVDGTVLDLFDFDQYLAFHGKQPPAGWRAAVPADIRKAAGNEFPDIIFLSAPCKGFSGLLPEASSATAKYQALNRLTLRGVWLSLEAFKDNPPSLYIFENVPRIQKRGRKLLDEICALFRAYGYAVAETTHDCGELGGLGQSRKRFLLVARHEAKVPPYLYQPEKKHLRGVGEILEKFPLPGDERGGAMHRMPALQWKTWVRLAFVEAGSDWRSLNKLAVADGFLRDFGIVPAGQWHDDILGVASWDSSIGTITGQAQATTGRFNVADPREFSNPHNGAMGVNEWDEPAGTVTGNGRPATGSFSVADPRLPDGGPEYQQYGVREWHAPSGAVINVKSPGQGTFSVADPRVDGHAKSVQLGVRRWDQSAACVKGDVSVGTGPYAVSDPRIEGKPRFNNVFRIVRWGDASPAVAGPGGPAGGLAIADPRADGTFEGSGKYRVTSYDEAAGTVIGASTTGQGAFALADPRIGDGNEQGSFKNSYDVAGWDEPSKTVTSGHSPSNGGHAVADPRMGWSEDAHPSKLSVKEWEEPARTVTGARLLSGGGAVADPRPNLSENAPQNILSVADWDDPAKTVTGAKHVAGGALSVADPRPGRPPEELHGKFHVTPFDAPSRAVIGGRENGAFVVADPRPVGLNANREHYMTGGHYGVVPWDQNSGAIPGFGKYDRGPWSVADPRSAAGDEVDSLPAPSDRLVAVIRALDGTWHRPFTTLELAALQSLGDPDELFALDGQSDSAWRERIGNAVPPDAAAAIAGVMGTTLLLAMTGQTFMLSSQDIWVKPLAIALSVDQRGNIPNE
jgi:site-specific DNA-cytosine methylase